MKYYVGLDVSMKKTSLCIVDQQGKIVHESVVNTDPCELIDAIEKLKYKIELVGFESGSLTYYLMQGFQKSSLNVVCIDARKMNTILSMQINKTDKNDARGIANALRTGMFVKVHEKSKESVDRGIILATRRCLIKQRIDIKNHIRGILKNYGIRLGSIGPATFSKEVKKYLQNLNFLVIKSIENILDIFDEFTKKIFQIDQELLKIARKDKEVRLLMTTHGIGIITALTYKTEIHDPCRFKNSKAVGAYLGMTPKQYSSGETIKQGHISKCGSSELRSLLMEAGIVILTRSKKWSKLKAWGLKLMRKKGIKKASMAVGRKLAVIMHKMLLEQKEFIYGKSANKAA